MGNDPCGLQYSQCPGKCEAMSGRGRQNSQLGPQLRHRPVAYFHAACTRRKFGKDYGREGAQDAGGGIEGGRTRPGATPMRGRSEERGNFLTAWIAGLLALIAMVSAMSAPGPASAGLSVAALQAWPLVQGTGSEVPTGAGGENATPVCNGCQVPQLYLESAGSQRTTSINLSMPPVQNSSSSEPNGSGAYQATGTGATPYYSLYDPINGYVYVANYGAASVTIVNGSTDTVIRTLAVGAGPLEMAYDSWDGAIYVPNSVSDNVSVIQGSSIVDNSMSGQYACSAPHSATFDPANGYIYIPCWGGGVVAIDGGTNPSQGTIVTTLRAGTDPRNAAYDSANRLLYVTNALSNNVSLINTSQQRTVGYIAVGAYPNWTAYDPHYNLVYVGNTNASTVSVINASTGSATTIRVGAGPRNITYDPSNFRVYVANLASNNVSVINGTSFVTGVSAGQSPFDGAYDSGNGWVYISDYGGSNLTAINATSDTASQEASGESPHSVTYDPGNGVLYVANSRSANLTCMATGIVYSVGQTRVGESPAMPAANPRSATIYIPNSGSGNVSVVSSLTNQVTGTVTISAGSDPTYAIFDYINGRVFVIDSGTNRVTVINGTTLVSSVNVGTSPRFAVLDPANQYVYVVNFGSDNVSVINTTTNTVASTIGVGTNPLAGTYDPENAYLYITDAGGASVSIINTNSNTVVKTQTVGQSPSYPAFDAADGYVYVPNYRSASISVLSGATVIANLTNVPEAVYATYDAFNGQVYVPSEQDNNVAILSGTSVAWAGAGPAPLFAAADPASGLVYVTDSGGRSVTILNGTSDDGAVSVGSSPQFAVYNPGSSEVYVPNNGSGNVTEIGVEHGGWEADTWGWSLGRNNTSGSAPCGGSDHYGRRLGAPGGQYNGEMYAYSYSYSNPDWLCDPDGTTRVQTLGLAAIDPLKPDLSADHVISFEFLVSLNASIWSYPCSSGAASVLVEFYVTLESASNNTTVYSTTPYHLVSNSNTSNETCEPNDNGYWNLTTDDYVVSWTSPQVFLTGGVTYTVLGVVTEETHASAPWPQDEGGAGVSYWGTGQSVELEGITVVPVYGS